MKIPQLKAKRLREMKKKRRAAANSTVVKTDLMTSLKRTMARMKMQRKTMKPPRERKLRIRFLSKQIPTARWKRTTWTRLPRMEKSMTQLTSSKQSARKPSSNNHSHYVKH